MTAIDRPTLYLNTQCPLCLKVRIFLLEAGLENAVEIVEFAPASAEEAEVKMMLATRLDKVTVPAARFAPDDCVADSDTIIARLASAGGITPATLPVLNRYADVALGRIVQLFRENAELKSRSVGS